MVEKLTIELDDNISKGIDNRVDGIKIKDRSAAVMDILSRALNRNHVKMAFILAGGKGTRMRPFTYEITKPMIPVQGKPLLQHTIDLLRKYNIRDIILSVRYRGDQIREYFGNGSRFGVNITYIEEKERLGTAGSLNLAREILDQTFLMFNGDILANIDLHDFIRFHKENRKGDDKNDGLATIALTPVEDPSQFGVVELEGKRITGFIEKPESPRSNLINAGIYVLEPEVIDYVPEGHAMMETDVFPKLVKEGRLYGYPFENQWFDTGTHDAYERVIKEWDGID